MTKMKKWNFYKIVCIFTAILFAFLSLKLLFDTENFISDLGLDPNESTRIITQRASMFMLGLSILMIGSSKLDHSSIRQFICLSTCISMLGLSILGSYELSKGTINSSIWTAIIIETILWLSFGFIFFKNIRSTTAEAKV